MTGNKDNNSKKWKALKRGAAFAAAHLFLAASIEIGIASFSTSSKSVQALEAVDVKPFKPEQQALFDEQEELYQLVNQADTSEYPQLIERLQALMKKQENIFGIDSANVSCSLDRLIMIYRELNKPALQIPLAERAFKIKEKLLGTQAPDTAVEITRLAGAFAYMGKFEKSIQLLTEYRNKLEALPEHRTSEIMIAYELGQTYSLWKKFKEAQPWYDKAASLKAQYAIRSRVYPSYSKILIARKQNLRRLNGTELVDDEASRSQDDSP